jgi:NAD(P)H-nitrite reductase large subunit
MSRYVIVGSGAAGISAAETIRCQEPSAEIQLISDDRHGYYSRPGLAYLLSGEIPENFIFPFREDYFRQLNLRRIQGRAMRILPASHRLELSDRKSLLYDRLLVASGSLAMRSAAPGADLDGVVKLDDLEDAHHIIRLARKGRSAVVVGGGITALEIVEGLVARGVKTHYFLRGDRYWSNVLDEQESRIVEARLKEDGVHIHFHTELAEILGKGGRVAGVRTKDRRTIPCDIVGVGIGIQPRLELARTSGLSIDRGLLVNEFMQTDAPDVYAAGDVAQVFDPGTGKTVLDSLWGPARDQGRVAAMNMLGAQTVYRKELAFNVTRLAGLTTTIIGTVGSGQDADLAGIARGDSETWRQLPDAIAAQTGFDVNRLRIIVGERTLLGAVIMGDQTLSRALQHLIRGQVDITSIRDKLLHAETNLGDLIADFWIQTRRENAGNPAQ